MSKAVTEVGTGIDSFHRRRTSSPTKVFSSQFNYDLMDHKWEQKANGAGATVTHDATNRTAKMAFSSSPAGAYAYLQSYVHVPYQEAKSHLILISASFEGHSTDAEKFFRYGTTSNGVELRSTAGDYVIHQYSSTTIGNRSWERAEWNKDRMDGKGPSKIVLQDQNIEIVVIQMQALKGGKVVVMLDIDGDLYPVHEIKNSNRVLHPYIATASLPIAVGMVATDTATTTMQLTCCAVISEGGEFDPEAIPCRKIVAFTASNVSDSHMVGLRPKTTYNGVENRQHIVLDSVTVLNQGSHPLDWWLATGQALSGEAWSDVGGISSCQYTSTAGSLSGSPSHTYDGDIVIATATIKTSQSVELSRAFPLTLNAAAANHTKGTLAVCGRSLGSASVSGYVLLKWHENR